MANRLRGILRKTFFCLVLIAALVTSAASAMAAGFSGNFNGIGTAADMTLNLQQANDRVVGRLSLRGGRSYALNGEIGDKGAQGTLRLGGAAMGVAFFRMETRPLGVQLLFIPARADGTADLAEAREYSFMTEGVAVPPANRALAAPAPGENVGVLRFIDEYRVWPSADVARIYATLDDRSQGLIQLYDHASTDILWRVCEAKMAGADVPEPVLHELLDRQQTTCEDLMPLVEAARKGGLFQEFERRARFQFEIVRETVLCNRGESSPSKCADVAALGAPLILHWRSASSIMRELAGVAGPPEGTGEEGTLAPYQHEASAPQPNVTAPAPGGQAAPASPAPPAHEPGLVSPPLRATIVDMPPKRDKATAMKAFLTAKRRGFRLPLPDPRR